MIGDHDSRLPKCEEHGNPALFCDPCDMLNHARRSTAYHRADRTPGTKWLSNHQDKTLRRILADLPDRITVAYQVLDGEKLGDNERGQSVPGSRPPLSLAVLDLTRTGTVHNDPIAHQTTRSAGILTMLESWVRLAESEMLDCDQNPTEAPQHATISSACAWLARHIVWITEQQWVTELLADLKQADTDVRHALRERAEYRPRCPKCGGWLEARFGFHTCNACGHETSTRMVLALQHPMTADQLAEAFDVTTTAIRKWVERGHLEPAVGEDGKVLKSGKAHRYHVTDVLRLIDADRTAGVAGVTLAEAARIVGIPDKTLHEWHSKGMVRPLTGSSVRRGRLFDIQAIREAAERMRRVS